jgi:hypothetical protein
VTRLFLGLLIFTGCVDHILEIERVCIMPEIGFRDCALGRADVVGLKDPQPSWIAT